MSKWLEVQNEMLVKTSAYGNNILTSLAVGKLLELYGDGGKGAAETGEKVERTVADGYEPAVQASV
jgi:hypothetical protein